MEDVDGHMWYLRYPLEDGSGHVTVATTRPETMFGDTAVALNPDDPRAEALRGKYVTLPIVGRRIPIIEDSYVVMPDPDGDAKAQIATGFLKVTPAHDPNDWDIGLRHDLPVINVMAADASISDRYGWDDAPDSAASFLGMSREDARAAVVAWFDEHELLEEVRDYSHSVGHSYRSHVPIEPWLSDQWYVAATDDRLAGSALRAQQAGQTKDLANEHQPGETNGDGELRFVPERYARTYQQWHENIRDWCISRQVWWGHRIPVWSRTQLIADADPETFAVASALDVGDTVPFTSQYTSKGASHKMRRLNEDEMIESICVPPQSHLERTTKTPEAELIAAVEADGFVQDADVLDTWFSSALWPMSTMGWPYPADFPETEGLLETFNPTSMLSTAREIITLWVSRMVMFNRYFMDGQLPFKDVFIHAMVQDGHGQKMSKSLGNGVDPRDIIYTHGTDAMRFTLVQMTTDTQDVRMPVDMICPHSGESFTPQFITTSGGHMVAAPTQTSPSDPSKTMVSAYGVTAGLAEPSDETPLARNSSSKFDIGRNFSNKVWNAVRFALSRLDTDESVTEAVDPTTLRFADRLILTRLAETIERLEKAIENYQFNVYADTVYNFVWHDVCDRYLEAVKPTIDEDPAQRAVLAAVLDASLRLMHPVCPFITEALWPAVQGGRCGDIAGLELPPSDLLATASWPGSSGIGDAETLTTYARTAELIAQIRMVRSERTVNPKQKIVVHAPGPVIELLNSADGFVETLSGVGQVVDIDDGLPAVSSPLAFEGQQVALSGLVDEVDIDAEKARLEKVIQQKSGQIKGFEAKLGNEGYVSNAPPHLVEETRGMLEAAKADLAAASDALGAL